MIFSSLNRRKGRHRKPNCGALYFLFCFSFETEAHVAQTSNSLCLQGWPWIQDPPTSISQAAYSHAPRQPPRLFFIWFFCILHISWGWRRGAAATGAGSVSIRTADLILAPGTESCVMPVTPSKRATETGGSLGMLAAILANWWATAARDKTIFVSLTKVPFGLGVVAQAWNLR